MAKKKIYRCHMCGNTMLGRPKNLRNQVHTIRRRTEVGEDYEYFYFCNITCKENGVKRIAENKKKNPREEKLVSKAIELGLLTREEYEKEYKGKYIDHYGIDSFVNYLEAAIYAKETNEDKMCFVTFCSPILKDVEKFAKKFNVHIVNAKMRSDNQ